MYFDFPVEMMKCNSRGNAGRDVQEPVTSDFLFDKETETMVLRSVLRQRVHVCHEEITSDRLRLHHCDV
ncbi:unnamed protein product, partial [Eruca vesicaria subsp. sativa]|nr:unnamed protein product [Eruca vesicaria subsp. sativa]